MKLSIVFVLATMTVATSAVAQPLEPLPPADQPQPVQPDRVTPAPAAPVDNVDRREGNWRVELGYRGSYIRSSEYNGPFSTNGFLPEVSIAASRTLIARGRFSFASGVAYDEGSSDATARGDPTSLSVQRVTVTLEGRLGFGPWGYAYLRAAPGAALQKAEITDPSSPDPLTKNDWLFATDLSAGYAWLVWPRWERSTVEPRLWLQAEGGYGWVAEQQLALAPALPPGSTDRVTGIDLGSLAMQGGYFRIAAAVSF